MSNPIDADKPINWLPDANPSKSSLVRGINEWCTQEFGSPITIEGLDRLEYDALLLLGVAMGYEPNEKMRAYLTRYRKTVHATVIHDKPVSASPAPTAFHLPDNQADTTLDQEMDLMEAREFPADNRHQ